MGAQQPDAELLREQLRYYDARAEEYDDWFYRRGRYDRGEEATVTWFKELGEVEMALDQLPLDGAELLELAPGTGLWTERLVERAASLTAVDGSLEMIEVAKRRLGVRWKIVTFIQADLFDWEPPARFDGVVFCFWISHVPRALLNDFARKVSQALKPGGFVFFLDSRRDPRSTAGDHVLPDLGEESMIRRLHDGREFSIVKNFWEPQLLVECFAEHGIALTISETPTYFQVGVGTRHPSSPTT